MGYFRKSILDLGNSNVYAGLLESKQHIISDSWCDLEVKLQLCACVLEYVYMDMLVHVCVCGGF